MKKTIISAVALCIFGMLAVSCGSTKNVQSPADVYEDEKTEEESISEDGDAVAIKKSDKKEKKAKDPKKKNFVQEMFTFGNRDEYQKYYEISLYEKEITGLKEKTQKVRITCKTRKNRKKRKASRILRQTEQ